MRDYLVSFSSLLPALFIAGLGVLAIIGLLWYALLKLEWLRHCVAGELRRLDQLEQTFKSSGASPHLSPPDAPAERAAQHANYVAAVQKVLANSQDRHSLPLKLLDAVWRQRNVKVPELAAAQSMVEEEAAQRLAAIRPIANLAMLTGLAGTVAGLSLAVYKLGPMMSSSMSASDPSNLVEKIAAPLNVLAAAFVCTLSGVLVAITVTAYASAVEARQNHLLNRLRDFALLELAPNLFPDSLEHQIELLQQGIAQSVGLLNSVSLNMQTAAEALRHNLERHVTQLARATTETITTLTKVTDFVSQSALKLDESVRRFDALQNKVHETYTALMDRHDSSQRHFSQRSGEVITAIENNQRAFNANATEIVRQLGHAVTRFDDSGAKFQTAGSHFENMSQVIGREAYEAIAARAEEFQQAIARHEQLSVLMDRQLRDLMAGLDELMTRLDPRLLPREEWAAVLEALGSVVAASQESSVRDRHYQEALDKFGAIVARAPKELSDLRNGLAQWLAPRLPTEEERRLTLEQLVASADRVLASSDRAVASSDRVAAQVGDLQSWQQNSLVDRRIQEDQTEKYLGALDEIRQQVIALREHSAGCEERQSAQESVNHGINRVNNGIVGVAERVAALQTWLQSQPRDGGEQRRASDPAAGSLAAAVDPPASSGDAPRASDEAAAVQPDEAVFQRSLTNNTNGPNGPTHNSAPGLPARSEGSRSERESTVSVIEGGSDAPGTD